MTPFMIPFIGSYLDPVITYARRPGRRTARLRYQTWLEAVRNKSPPVFTPSIFNPFNSIPKAQIVWPNSKIKGMFSPSDEELIQFWRTCPKPTLAFGLLASCTSISISASHSYNPGVLQYTCIECGLGRKDKNHYKESYV